MSAMKTVFFRDFVSSQFSDKPVRFVIEVQEDDRDFVASARVYNDPGDGYRQFTIAEVLADFEGDNNEQKAAIAFLGLISALMDDADFDTLEEMAQDFYDGLMAEKDAETV